MLVSHETPWYLGGMVGILCHTHRPVCHGDFPMEKGVEQIIFCLYHAYCKGFALLSHVLLTKAGYFAIPMHRLTSLQHCACGSVYVFRAHIAGQPVQCREARFLQETTMKFCHTSACRV